MKRLSAADVERLRALPSVVAWLCSACGSAVPRKQRECGCDAVGPSVWGQIADGSPDLADVVDRRSAHTGLLAALQSLSPDQRSVVLLRLSGRGWSEVSESLGVSVEAARDLHTLACIALQKGAPTA